MDKLDLNEKLNKIVELIPVDTFLQNPELSEYLSQIRHELRPKDPKGGAPKKYHFNGHITVFQVDDVYSRLKQMGIKDKKLAIKIVAYHYFRASPYALKRHYDHWKREETSAQMRAFLEQQKWSDSYLQRLLKEVQN